MTALGREDGFSLVELLVGVVLLGLVSSGAFSLLASSVRAEHVAGEVRDEIEDVRVALDRLRKDVRSTTDVRAGSDGDTLLLWLDDDQDRSPTSAELVTYQLVTVAGRGELRRWTDAQTSAQAQVVARGLVVAPLFSYTVNAAGQTEEVAITVSAASDTSQLSKVTTNTTTVRVRNVTR